MKALKLIVFSIAFLSLQSYSQEKSILNQINSDVWMPFTKAFETKNIDLFKQIHSNKLIRVAANAKQIKDFETYTSDYGANWETITREQTISFRFLERISDNNTASERGIYKFTMFPNTEQEQSFYGKFHVFLINENSTWKILIDYDSNENNSIDKDSYQKAFAMDDFDKYQ